ncbi:unnamed protein product [Gongylonema pulchrum]|uniref:Uncharacterized protein n=1 Tax=Gongylonema pulchrum TaxID=637853 RepID=A0A3P6PMR0_9BILA|nr:unnamed protein product [Gongylonema pulchrum]
MKRKRFVTESVDSGSDVSKSCELDPRGGESSGKRQKIVESSAATKSESSAPNSLITELQERIGGTNEGALALLEQLKRCLAGGTVSSNIHVNPEVIRKTV